MHVLITGAAGLIGSNTMKALLKEGHKVTATDISPLSSSLIEELASYPIEQFTADLTSPKEVDRVFDSASSPFDAVVHVGGIRSPVGMDPRIVHNVNVTSTYNVLQTAVSRGVGTVIQASSCNALGLSWTQPEHWNLDYVPVNEKHPKRPEDAYSLSKMIIEAQAESLCRLYPTARIASIRMHFTRQSLNETTSGVKHTGLWAWSSVEAVVRSITLAISSEKWSGAEVFHIADDEIYYPLESGDGLSSLELLERHWPGKVGVVNKDWWEGNPRRSFFDTSKAKTLLGWSHAGL